jgi:hypothetical protein
MSRIMHAMAVIFIMVSFCLGQDMNGKWSGEMQSPNGPMVLTFSFKVNGDTLTGTVESGMGELPISNGKVDGNTFTFDVSLGEMVIHHYCTYMKDSISLKYPGMQGDTVEMYLKRPPALK